MTWNTTGDHVNTIPDDVNVIRDHVNAIRDDVNMIRDHMNVIRDDIEGELLSRSSFRRVEAAGSFPFQR